MKLTDDEQFGMCIVCTTVFALVLLVSHNYGYDSGMEQGVNQVHNDICNHFGYEVQSPYTTDRIWCYDKENDVFVKVKFVKVKVGSDNR